MPQIREINENYYNQAKLDFLNKDDAWVEVSGYAFYDALCQLPPIYCDRGFFMGEIALHHKGEPFYYGFVEIGERYFCRMSSEKLFPQQIQILNSLLYLLEKWEDTKKGEKLTWSEAQLDFMAQHFMGQDSADAKLWFSRFTTIQNSEQCGVLDQLIGWLK